MRGVTIPIIGHRFGRLIVISEVGLHIFPSGQQKMRYLCRCDCGQETTALSQNLRKGQISSCGCYQKESTSKRFTTHGQSSIRKGRSRAYRAWEAMCQRCSNDRVAEYAAYGGRGITVCERWKKFENFLEDMGECPDKLTIDRVNNDGNYEPGNCRWATAKEQALNRRSCRVVEYGGQQMPLKKAGELSGTTVSYHKVRQRLVEHGWSLENALSETGCSAEALAREARNREIMRLHATKIPKTVIAGQFHITDRQVYEIIQNER